MPFVDQPLDEPGVEVERVGQIRLVGLPEADQVGDGDIVRALEWWTWCSQSR
jgi:hypothetical protein